MPAAKKTKDLPPKKPSTVKGGKFKLAGNCNPTLVRVNR